MHIEQAGS